MNVQQTAPMQMSHNGQKQAAGLGNLFTQLMSSAKQLPAENSDGLGGIVASLFSNDAEIELFWNNETVNDEDVQALLDGLPAEVKESIETLLKDSADALEIAFNPTPEMKLAFLVQALVNDQHQVLSEPQKKEINALIEKWFPAIKFDNKDSLPKQIQQIFDQVKKQLNEQETQDKNTFHKIMENLSAAKKIQSYAEQAYQRYVPTKQGDQPISTAKELTSVQSPLSPLEQWTLKVPVTQDEGQKQQFVREIQQIITRGKVVVNEAGFAKLQIKLTPEHLGTIEIHLIQKQGEIAAKIIASSQAAKDALDGQLSQLKQAFAGQNIDFEKLEVFFQGEEQSLKEYHDQKNQKEENHNQSEQHAESDTETSSLTFEEQLSQMVLNEKV